MKPIITLLKSLIFHQTDKDAEELSNYFYETKVVQPDDHFSYSELDRLINSDQLVKSPRYQHLQSCEDCRKKLKDLDRGRGLIVARRRPPQLQSCRRHTGTD